MPTETFFNLSDEKRKRIEDSALREFVQNSFENSSVAGIVETADIPRGSFYQYFDDLTDLYVHIFHRLAEEKMKYMRDVTESDDKDALSIIRNLYSAGLRFATENPKYAAVGVNFMREPRAFREMILNEFGSSVSDFLRDILQKGQKRGEIDENIDLDIGAFVLDSMNNAVLEHCLQNYDPQQLIDDGSEYMYLMDKVLYILQWGLAPRAGPGEGN